MLLFVVSLVALPLLVLFVFFILLLFKHSFQPFLLLSCLLVDLPISLSQLVSEALFNFVSSTFLKELMGLFLLNCQLLFDILSVDLLENTGEFLERFVEQREDLVGLKIQI
jgi:hypothetical protein